MSPFRDRNALLSGRAADAQKTQQIVFPELGRGQVSHTSNSVKSLGEEGTDPREEMLVRKRKECEELREMLLELNNRADHEARLRALAEEDARALRE